MKKSKNLSPKEIKKQEAKLHEVGVDINNILSLINSLNNIDEAYDVNILENKVNIIKKEIETKYKDILNKNNIKDLDTEEKDNTEKI